MTMNENVTVCITPKGDKPILHFSQFDNENVFTVTVLADDGESAAVLTGLDIEFRIRKTDSHVVTIAPESVADNVITFKTTEQMCACCGQNIATVTLMKDDLVISTLDILVDIQRDILSGGLTSESDIRNLTTQIEQIVPEVLADDYYTKTEVDELIDDIPTFDPTNYYDKSDVDGLLADKADSDDVMTKVTRHGLGGDVSYYSFDNNCVSPMDNLECAVEAVQDLHGYSKPWSGGAEKNILVPTAIDTTSNNVRVVGDSSGKVTVTGTASADTQIEIYSFVVASPDTYTLILKDNLSGSNNTYWVSMSGVGIITSGKRSTFAFASAGTFKLRINVKSGSATNFTIYPMVAKGNVDIPYEPYSNICPISGHSSCTITVADSDDTPVNTCTVSFGQDVYGGVADVTGGKATLTHAIVDLGTLSWTPYINTFYAQLNNAKSPSSASTVADIICSQYEADTLNHVLGKTTDGIIAINDQQSRVHIYDSTKSSMTGADFKTAMSGVQLVYELATPIEITFTPATTDTINGTNKVSSSTGNMKSLTYFSDVNSDLVDLIRACMI